MGKLVVTAMTEVSEPVRTNVYSLATGRPLVWQPPQAGDEYILVRGACIVCHRPFWWLRVVGKPGRKRRFCSDDCNDTRHLQLMRRRKATALAFGTLDLFPLERGGQLGHHVEAEVTTSRVRT